MIGTRLIKKLALGFFFISLTASLVSCDPDSEKKENKPEKKPIKATGWASESDDPGAVQENIVNPYDQVAEGELPTKVDLSQYLPPIGDQGNYGTCVAWATAYNLKTALEAIKFGFTQNQLNNPANQLSPKYLFTALSSSDKNPDCGGTSFAPALALMQMKGVATKNTVPYSDLGNCSESNINPSWDEEAKKHKIKTYRRIDGDVLSIKRALANKMPVLVGCKLDDAFMQWNSDVVYQFSGPNTEVGIHAAHAMCIVGYDNNKLPAGAFKVVNSWSNQWGASGFIWVDYKFMVNDFTLGDNKANKNLYVAINDDQKPIVQDPGTTISSGKNLTAWIFNDYSAPDNFSNTRRDLKFNIYNTGTDAISSSLAWGYAFIYYNAYDADDYDIVLYDNFDPSAPIRYVSDNYNSFNGFILNVDIPSGSSLAYEYQGDRSTPNDPSGGDTLIRGYYMPNTLNGSYYTLFVADLYDAISESNEIDNLFYITENGPTSYTNGVGARKNTFAEQFNNPVPISKINSNEVKAFRTAVNSTNRNAYTPEEVIYFLKREAKNGGLARKIADFKNTQRKGKLTPGFNR